MNLEALVHTSERQLEDSSARTRGKPAAAPRAGASERAVPRADDSRKEGWERAKAEMPRSHFTRVSTFSFKRHGSLPGRVAHLVGALSLRPKVAGLIPGQAHT